MKWYNKVWEWLKRVFAWGKPYVISWAKTQIGSKVDFTEDEVQELEMLAAKARAKYDHKIKKVKQLEKIEEKFKNDL